MTVSRKNKNMKKSSKIQRKQSKLQKKNKSRKQIKIMNHMSGGNPKLIQDYIDKIEKNLITELDFNLGNELFDLFLKEPNLFNMLIPALKNNTSIHKLILPSILNHMIFNEEYLNILFKTNTTITQLNLTGNSLSIDKLPNIFQSKFITELNLSECRFLPSDLAKALETNSTLEVLNLTNVCIIGLRSNGCKVISEAIKNNPNTKIHTLILDDNNINKETDKGIESLANLLLSNTTIKHLSLQENQLNNNVLYIFKDVFSTNTSLEFLDLSDTAIYDLKIILSALNNNTKSNMTINLIRQHDDVKSIEEQLLPKSLEECPMINNIKLIIDLRKFDKAKKELKL